MLRMSVVYNAAQSQILLFSGQNASQVFDDTWTFAPPQNFGNINVCPSGQSTPAPCNNTMPLVFNFTASSTTVGSAKVVTQGASNLDFTLANTAGSNCVGNTWTAGTSCTELVTFAPRAPGLRTGAVQLFDSSVPANLLATALISGIGQAPEIVYGPAFSGTTILGGPSLENVLTTTGFTPDPRGMTTDASGNLYIAAPSNGQSVEAGSERYDDYRGNA